MSTKVPDFLWAYSGRYWLDAARIVIYNSSTGGGGGSTTGLAQGVYSGTSSTGVTFDTIVLPNDKFYAIYGIGAAR